MSETVLKSNEQMLQRAVDELTQRCNSEHSLPDWFLLRLPLYHLNRLVSTLVTQLNICNDRCKLSRLIAAAVEK